MDRRSSVHINSGDHRWRSLRLRFPASILRGLPGYNHKTLNADDSTLQSYTMATKPYQLAFTLHGHASDVRAIFAPAPGVPLLLSGSRDGSALLWGPSGGGSGGAEWDVKLRVEAPEKKYVSCVGMTRWEGEGESECAN